MKLLLCYLLIFSSFGALAEEFKVVTFNVYRKPEIGNESFSTERMKEICHVLKNKSHQHNNDWDVVLFQEVWTVGARKILKDCGYQYSVDIGEGHWNVSEKRKNRSGDYKPMPGSHGQELNLGSGLLILSRFPILKALRYQFINGGRLTSVFKDGERLVKKSVYLAQLQLNNREKIWIANTHLIANYCDNAKGEECESYEDVRSKQLLEMKSVFDKFVGDAPLVFAGDLNTGEHPNAKERSWYVLHELFPDFSQAPHNELTVSTSSPTNFFKTGHEERGKLDHIFASADFFIGQGSLAFEKKFKSENGMEINYSDHYGWQSTVLLK
jgi:endonuclease/exonuclease/phosphatase family metal-dependent hydrolase